MPWLAGVLLAAPFAAVMSSVDSFLLMVSSAVVRDIYQNRMRPTASERSSPTASYIVTSFIGIAVMCLHCSCRHAHCDLIVFASGGLAGCFLIPVLLMLFWQKMTGAGAIAGMLGGFAMHTGLLIALPATYQVVLVATPLTTGASDLGSAAVGCAGGGRELHEPPPWAGGIDRYF
ncbi:MAG: hypothetical protein R3F19_32195 [Verrucomicrobiales bacterium]